MTRAVSWLLLTVAGSRLVLQLAVLGAELPAANALARSNNPTATVPPQFVHHPSTIARYGSEQRTVHLAGARGDLLGSGTKLVQLPLLRRRAWRGSYAGVRRLDWDKSGWPILVEGEP